MLALRQSLGTVTAVLASAVLLLVVTAGPALAHGRGSDATNFESEVTGAPDVPGVTWQVYGGDEYLGVTNVSDTEVVVYGYPEANPEPYLRVGPEGVFENRNSPSTYLNQDRFAATPLPDNADSSAEPDWVKVSDGQTYLWHDHRIHFMGTDPSGVVPDPSVRTVVFDGWSVPFSMGDPGQAESLDVTGELVWVPGGSPLPWLAGALLVSLIALVGLRTKPSSEDRWPGLARPAAAVLGVITLLNLTHLTDDLFAVPLPLGTRALAAGQTALFIGIAAFGAVKAWQAREGAFTALGVGAGALLVGQGLLYLSVLSTSQAASLLPGAVTRAIVALSIAQALPVGIVAVIGTRRLLPSLDAPASAEDVPATAS